MSLQRKSFLIIYPCKIEETIAALVLLRYFKRGIIDWVVSKEAVCLVRGQGKVRHVYTPDQIAAIRDTHYDVAFDVHGGFHSGIILALARAKDKVASTFLTSDNILGTLFATRRFPVIRRFSKEHQCLSLPMDFRRDFKPWPEQVELDYSIDASERWEIEHILARVGQPRFLVAPGARYKTMEIPAKKWIAFLHSLHVPVILYYHRRREKPLIDQIADSVDGVVIVGQWRAEKLQNLIKRLDGVVGVDNLAIQLAKTTKTKTLSFYGATRHEVWAKDLSMQKQCPYHIDFDSKCPSLRTCQSGACMNFSGADMINDFKYHFDA